ncbi:MAG: helix-turn-helix transcriptional regulator [Salinisphaera sp.]|nr:helix-turn-helix transcriptional regulator [Salinisphaera sp.]
MHSRTDRHRPLSGEPAGDGLTRRERQMLWRLFRGDINRQMAAAMFVSENTVKFHLKNIYRKLGVSNRVQAIRATGFLDPARAEPWQPAA